MAQTKTRKTKTQYKTPKPKKMVAVKEQAAQYSSRHVVPTEHPIRAQTRKACRNVVTVRAIVEITYRLKQPPEEILEGWEPYLTLAGVYDALSYYHDHKKEIDGIIAANDRVGERALELSRKSAQEYKERQRLKAQRAKKDDR